MMATATHTAPPRRADEVVWELLRDEWDLLLAVGSGPTSLDTLVRRTDVGPDALVRRLGRLTAHGLLDQGEEGWTLVAAVYERQEAMSSYIQELVLSRVSSGVAPALELVVRRGIGPVEGLAEVHRSADDTVLREVVEIASGPEPEHVGRYLVVFAATTLPLGERDSGLARAMDVLRGAAIERARGAASGLARMWVGEMRVSPENAVLVAGRLEKFARALNPTSFGGALVVAVWPVSGAAQDEVAN